MSKRFLPLCAAVFTACGPEVTARDAPMLDGRAAANAAFEHVAGEPVGTEPAAMPVSFPTAGAEIVLPAFLYSDHDAEVGARTTGVIAAIRAELGDAVRAGQVLAVLDDAREAARVVAAKATLERAQTEQVRTAELRQNGYVTQAELDDANHRLRTAEVELQLAEVEFAHTRVLAPFAGVVTRRLTGQGRHVREGEPLFRVTALRPLHALVRLPERDARGLRAGTAALLVADDGSHVETKVSRIAPAVDPGSGTVEVLFNVPQPGPLRPGSTATLRLARPAPAGLQ
jgi:RND family efflux transporter MFP subunit